MRSRFGLPAVTVTHTLYRSNHALSRCSCHRRFVGSEVRANDLRHTEGLFEKWRPSWGLQGIEKGTSARGLAPGKDMAHPMDAAREKETGLLVVSQHSCHAPRPEKVRHAEIPSLPRGPRAVRRVCPPAAQRRFTGASVWRWRRVRRRPRRGASPRSARPFGDQRRLPVVRQGR